MSKTKSLTCSKTMNNLNQTLINPNYPLLPSSHPSNSNHNYPKTGEISSLFMSHTINSWVKSWPFLCPCLLLVSLLPRRICILWLPSFAHFCVISLLRCLRLKKRLIILIIAVVLGSNRGSSCLEMDSLCPFSYHIGLSHNLLPHDYFTSFLIYGHPFTVSLSKNFFIK